MVNSGQANYSNTGAVNIATRPDLEVIRRIFHYDDDVWPIKHCSSFVRLSDNICCKQEAQLLLGDRATRKHAKDSRNGRGNDNLG